MKPRYRRTIADCSARIAKRCAVRRDRILCSQCSGVVEATKAEQIADGLRKLGAAEATLFDVGNICGACAERVVDLATALHERRVK